MVDYDTAVKMLTHDSNKTALWNNNKIKLENMLIIIVILISV